MEEITLTALDGYKLTVHVFNVEKPKGYIQIIHGMEEHQERYEPLIFYLNREGYSVISSDMRGHGKDAPLLGYFAPKLGYKLLLDDQKIITRYIQKTYKVKQVTIFAHSMGTIITRNLLQTESMNYKKVILSGFPCPQKEVGLGLFLTKLIMKFRGPKYFSKFVEKMALGKFNNAVKNHQTSFDWISFNKDNIKAYGDDPLCGQPFSISAYNDLFHLVKFMAIEDRYINIKNNLPILMLRGDSDPCTGYDKGAKKSISILKNVGFENIEEIKYEHMRHEILNEKNAETVIYDILEFLNN